jgi:hypothetical protein
MAFHQNDQFTVNLEESSPRFIRPDILTHPHIPRCAEGRTPRTMDAVGLVESGAD